MKNLNMTRLLVIAVTALALGSTYAANKTKANAKYQKQVDEVVAVAPHLTAAQQAQLLEAFKARSKVLDEVETLRADGVNKEVIKAKQKEAWLAQKSSAKKILTKEQFKAWAAAQKAIN